MMTVFDGDLSFALFTLHVLRKWPLHLLRQALEPCHQVSPPVLQ